MATFRTLRTRKVDAVPNSWNGISETGEELLAIHGTVLKNMWLHFKGGFTTGVYLENEWQEAGRFLSGRIVSERDYLSSAYAKQHAVGESLITYSSMLLKSDLAKKNLSELLGAYASLRGQWIAFDRHNLFPWYLGGDPFQDYVHSECKRAAPGITGQELTIMGTSPYLTVSSREELSIAQVVAYIQQNNLTSLIKGAEKEFPLELKDKIQELADNYRWLAFGYDGPELNTFAHYVNILAMHADNDQTEIIRHYQNYGKELKKKQSDIERIYRISPLLKKSFEKIRLLSRMTDQRKAVHFQANVAFYGLLQEIAPRIQVDLRALRWVTFEELCNFYEEPEKLIGWAQERNSDTCIFSFQAGVTTILVGEKAKELEALFFPRFEKAEYLKGVVGSRGDQPIIRGRARLLLSAKDQKMLQDGEILVTSMTTPEFVPAMRRSAAIVTDEGGVTCHAAIFAREMKKACLTATKVASKTFRDGDLLELNMEKGEVRCISAS